MALSQKLFVDQRRLHISQDFFFFFLEQYTVEPMNKGRIAGTI